MNALQDIPGWDRAVEWLRRAQRVVAFTGAGISTESGIATFRDEAGFWQKFPPEDFATWSGLVRTLLLQPQRFCEFLLAVLEPIANAQPNAGHLALAELERTKHVTVVTQNIDGLHQAAGSTIVYEVHGSLFEIVRMTSSRPVGTLTREELKDIVAELRKAETAAWPAPRILKAIQPLFGISLDGSRRPNIVLFGDGMAEPAWSNSQAAVDECDLLISVGTSHAVYPAATLPDRAQARGTKVIVVDPQAEGGDVWLRGRAAKILPELVNAAGERFS